MRKQRRESFYKTGCRVVDIRRVTLEYQQKLAVAIRSQNKSEAISIMNKMLRSKEVRLYAVYRTISSVGSRTKGLYDKKRPTTVKEYFELASKLWDVVKKPESYSSTPLKRKYIPKPNKPKDLRPLSVPSYVDRVVQQLYLFILQVFHEEVAEPNSFGFRPFRSPGMAAKAITLITWQRKGFKPPRYAVELDIKKCFDQISHEFILKNVAKMSVKGITYEVVPQHIMQQWCRSGYIDIEEVFTPKDQVIPTEVGVPQA
jgi:RNA-directed DNA polymerase